MQFGHKDYTITPLKKYCKSIRQHRPIRTIQCSNKWVTSINPILIPVRPKQLGNRTFTKLFIPNSDRLSQILSYEFGRGTIRRNVTDLGIGRLLNWKWDLIVGYDTPSSSSDGSNEYKVPYNGNISISPTTNHHKCI